MKQLERTVRTTLDTTLQQFSSVAMAELIKDVRVEKARKKDSRQAMLDSLCHEGLCHENSSELMDMVMDEWQSDKQERTSGNGPIRDVWNYETESYDYHVNVGGTETSHQSQVGIDRSLTDYDGEIDNKNTADIPAYQLIDDDGLLTRLDDMSDMVTVDNSSYSIWDTIFQKGQLNVRATTHWDSLCMFKKDGYRLRETKRYTRIHRKLLCLTHSTIKADKVCDNTLRRIAVKQLNADKKGNPSLSKLTRNARRGNQLARDELVRIGYNALSFTDVGE